eukprot:g2490.t1
MLETAMSNLYFTDTASSCEPVFSNSSERKALQVIPLIGAAFSILGGIFIVVTFLMFERVRKMTTFRLIALMSVSDIFSSISRFVNVSSDADEDGNGCDVSTACYVQAGMSQYFETSGFFWVLCISVHIYYLLHVVKGAPTSRQRCRMFAAYNAVSWGLPLLLLAVAIATGVLGDAGQWCWISKDHQWARISLYYIFMVGVAAINMVIYVTLTRVFRGRQGFFENHNPLAFRLRLYLLAFVATHFFSIINRLQNIIDPDKPIFLLYLLQSIFEPLNGLWNAGVYGMNHVVMTEYKKFFEKKGWFHGAYATESAGSEGKDFDSGPSLSDLLLRGTQPFDAVNTSAGDSDGGDGVRVLES